MIATPSKKNVALSVAKEITYETTGDGMSAVGTSEGTGSAVRGASAAWAVLEAHALLKSQEWARAKDACAAILALDSEHLGALEVRAQAEWFCAQYSEVIETTTQLLRLNPSEPGYRYTRGMAFLSKGELVRARSDFQYAFHQSTDEKFRDQVATALDTLDEWQGRRSMSDVPAVRVQLH